MGYLSHVTFCGVSPEEQELRMYQCNICDKKMFPSSRYYHDSSHAKHQLEMLQPPEFIDIGAPGPPSKRAAAVKARSFIRDFDVGEPGDPIESVDKFPAIEFKVQDVENKRVSKDTCAYKNN